MLIELRVETSASIADLDLRARARADRDHRRDRRGQDAARRGARAAGRRPGRRRRSCGPAPPRRVSRAASCDGDDELVLRRVVPADGRSRGLRRRPPGDRGRARRARARARRPARPARPPDLLLGAAVQRARSTASRARRPGAARTRAAPAQPSIDAELAGARRRRPRPGPRGRPAALPGRARSTRPPSTTPTRTRGSTPRRTLLADAVAHREARAGAVAALEGRGARRARRARRRARRPGAVRRARASGCAALPAELDDVAAELRVTRRARRRRPASGSTRCGSAASCSASCAASTATTLADVIGYGDRGAARGSPSSRATRQRAAELEAERGRGRGPRPPRRHGRRAAPACGGAALAAAVAGHLRRAGHAQRPRVEVDGRPTTTTATTCHVPARRQPGRAAAAAGQGGVRRRAGPGDAGAAAASSPRRRRPWCSTRSTPASAARRRSRSGARWPTSGQRHQVLVVTHLAQVAAFAEHQVVVDEAGGRRARRVAEARAGRAARPGSSSCRGCCRGSARARSARRHAASCWTGRGRWRREVERASCTGDPVAS